MKAVLALLLMLMSFSACGRAETVCEGSWQALRQAHDGRPTIMHFWGLTCGPCLVELPEWAGSRASGATPIS